MIIIINYYFITIQPLDGRIETKKQTFREKKVLCLPFLC